MNCENKQIHPMGRGGGGGSGDLQESLSRKCPFTVRDYRLADWLRKHLISDYPFVNCFCQTGHQSKSNAGLQSPVCILMKEVIWLNKYLNIFIHLYLSQTNSLYIDFEIL